MNKDQIKALLALNEEQISLLEEWNDLKNRMEKANMMYLIGYDGNNNIIPVAIQHWFSNGCCNTYSQALVPLAMIKIMFNNN